MKMANNLSEVSGVAKLSKFCSRCGLSKNHTYETIIWSLIIDWFGLEKVRYRPVDKILGLISLG